VHVTLLAPAGLLLALGAVPALGALAYGERRAGRTRFLLGLRPPGRFWRIAAAAALCLAAVLLGVAASRPVVRETQTRYVRTDAEAIFALDISRSMLAATSPGGATRLARAKAAAKSLRTAISDVPAGVASFTDRTLPNLFPTPDENVFAATVDRSVGIERPPPGGSSLTATTFDALAVLGGNEYFTLGRRRRLLVVLTDAESGDFDASRLRATLGRATGLRTVLVRIGSPRERVFGREGLPEADYRPQTTARTVASFVEATGARAFDESRLGGAAAAVREDVGRGPNVRIGTVSSSTDLAPFLVLAAFLPLALVLRLRNVL
jgi:hypothetical protein